VSSRDANIIQLWLEQRSLYTQACYRRDSRRLLNHVNKPLARITFADLLSFAQSLIESGLVPISRVRTLAAIKSLFGFCFRTRFLPLNPAAELALPSYEKRLAERIANEEDVQRMLQAKAAPRDRVLLRLLYAAGLRVSEAYGLRWRNLSSRGEVGQITVFGKSGRTRAIALPAPLWSELMALRGKARMDDPVFPSRRGGHWIAGASERSYGERPNELA
jgi:integrase/recombinase XerD